jgi:hypothetical protein
LQQLDGETDPTIVEGGGEEEEEEEEEEERERERERERDFCLSVRVKDRAAS